MLQIKSGEIVSRPDIVGQWGLRHFSCSIFLGWLLRHNLEDDEDNEIGLRARDFRARRGVPWEPLGRISGGKGESIVSGLRGSFRVAAQLADATASGASNSGGSYDAGDSLWPLEMSQRAVCSKDIRRNVGDRAAVRPENTASCRTRSTVRPFRRRPGQRTVADAWECLSATTPSCGN